MSLFDKLQWFFMIAAILFGLAIGKAADVAETAARFIVPFLMVMLFGVFLQTPAHRLREGFSNAKVVGLSLFINFLWTPFLAYGLSFLFFSDSPEVFVALIMDMVTPCTDWYLVFTAIAGGHVALSTSLLPWNLFMQLILMPIYLFIFAGTMVEIQPYIFLQSFFRVLFIPFTTAVIFRNGIIFFKGKKWFIEKVLDRVGSLQSIFLILAITAMFASQGVILIDNINIVIRLILPVTLFFVINFTIGLIIGIIFKLSYQEGVSLIITILARNAPLALTIAVAVFPDRSLIPLVLAVESLIELPMLFIFAQILLVVYHKKWWPNLS